VHVTGFERDSQRCVVGVLFLRALFFSAGLNPAKPDFSGWLRLSKIAAG